MKVNYRYWIALLLALMVAIAAEASAEPSHSEVVRGMYADDPATAHAVCAAWNAMVASKAQGQVREIIGAEGRRHVAKVREQYGEPQTAAIIKSLLETGQAEYNAGHIAWGDLVTLAASCMEI